MRSATVYANTESKVSGVDAFLLGCGGFFFFFRLMHNEVFYEQGGWTHICRARMLVQGPLYSVSLSFKNTSCSTNFCSCICGEETFSRNWMTFGQCVQQTLQELLLENSDPLSCPLPFILLVLLFSHIAFYEWRWSG